MRRSTKAIKVAKAKRRSKVKASGGPEALFAGLQGAAGNRAMNALLGEPLQRQEEEELQAQEESEEEFQAQAEKELPVPELVPIPLMLTGKERRMWRKQVISPLEDAAMAAEEQAGKPAKKRKWQGVLRKCDLASAGAWAVAADVHERAKTDPKAAVAVEEIMRVDGAISKCRRKARKLTETRRKGSGLKKALEDAIAVAELIK